MKIMVINPNSSQGMTDSIRAELERIRRKDTQLTVTCLASGPEFLQSSYDKALAVPPMLELVRQANSGGYDAVIIAAFCDPGLDAAREISDIPVLGLEETTLHVASMLGAKYTILTMTDHHVPHKEAEIRHYRLEASCASVRPLGLTVEQTHAEPDRTKKRILEVARLAAEQDGAEVFVLGCAGMVGYAEEISRTLGLAVLDPTGLTLKIAEGMVEAGLRHSKRALYARPRQKKSS